MIEGHFTESTETSFPPFWPVVHIPTGNVQYWWPHIKHFVDMAMQYAVPQYDVLPELFSGNMGLFCPMDEEGFPAGVMVVQLQPRMHEQVLFVVLLAGGNKVSWDRFWPQLVALAKKFNCVAIEGAGRKGFMKWTESYGMRPVYTVYRAEV